MKFFGQNINEFISRFRSEVYLEHLSSTKNNQVLLIDENEKVTTLDSLYFMDDTAGIYGIESSSSGRQTLFIGEDNNLISYITKRNHSDGAGGKLNITAGSATATTSGNNANGGNLSLISGRGLGSGTSHVQIITSTTTASGMTAIQDSTTTWDFQGKVHSNPYAILEVDDDFALLSQGNMMFGIDSNTGETGQGWSWNNDAQYGGGTAVMTLNESGDLQIDGDLTVSGGDITLSGTGRIQGIDTVTDSTDAASKAYVDGAVGGGLSFDGSTANGLLTYKDADEITVESNATYDGTDLTLTSATSGKPILTIENSNTDAVSPILKFAKTATGADADEIGRIQFEADDDADNPTVFAEIKGEIQDVTNSGTSEDGQLELLVAQGASLVNVLTANSNLGFGTQLTFGDGGLLSTTTFKSTIVSFESGGAAGAPIFSSVNQRADADGPQFTFIKNRNNTSGAGSTLDGDSCGLFNFRGYDAAGNVTTYAWMEGTAVTTSSGNEAGKFEIKVTSDGSITANNRNVITGTGHTTVDKVDIDLGYGAASTTTVAGDLSVTTGLILDSVDITTIQTSGESFADNDTSLMTSAAIDDRINAASGSVSVTDSTTDSDFPVVFCNGDTLHDDSGSFTYNPSDQTLKLVSSTSLQPDLLLQNDNADASPPTIAFKKSANGSDDDEIGIIYFLGDDDGGTQTTYAIVKGGIKNAADGNENGELEISVSNNASNVVGFKMEADSSTAGEVDITLGAGAASTTTVTGELEVAEKITLGSASNDEYEITLVNDENTAQIGLSNSSNDFVNGAQDGDLVINSVGDHQIIFAQNDTSCARLDTDGKFVGAPQLVKLSKDDLYLTYVSTQDYYYSFGAIGLNFGNSIGSELDSSAIRSCSFIAPYGCTVKKVTIAFYITSSCTLEFYFGKVPLVDDSTSNVTIVEMTSTDHNGSYTANKNYVKSFDISGPNSILSEGHGLAIFARRTDASGTSIIYGNAFADIRIN